MKASISELRASATEGKYRAPYRSARALPAAALMSTTATNLARGLFAMHDACRDPMYPAPTTATLSIFFSVSFRGLLKIS
jgi:hypothetical protein